MNTLSNTSTAFASIVGLLGQFVAEHRATTAQGYEEFRAWLADNRHGDVVRLLEQNGATVTSIKALLAEDRAALMQRFDKLDYQLAVVASMVRGFTELAYAVRPETRLSNAAFAFLRDIERSGASQVRELATMSGRQLLALESNGRGRAALHYQDDRFFEDDIQRLLDARLLRVEHAPHGHRIFHFTRQAAELVQSLGGTDEQPL